MDTKPENEVAKALVEFERPKITERDCEVLRVFVGSDSLLYALKNVFYGIASDEDKQAVSRLQTEEMKKVLKKFFNPEISPDDPIGKSMDLFKTQDIANATEENFNLVWKSKTLLVEMLEKALENVDGGDNEIDLTPKKDLAFMTARNNYIDFVSQQIQNIIMNAHRKAETVEQMLERKRKDSSK